MQTPIKFFLWLGYVMKASPLHGFMTVWRARPHTLSPTVQTLRQVPIFYKSCRNLLDYCRDHQQVLNHLWDSLLHKLFCFVLLF